MIKDYLSSLRELTVSKQKDEIKNVLESIPNSIEKGIVFEEYIKLLFLGRGYIAIRNGSSKDGGADILVYLPNNPEKVFLVIQAKNHKRPLDFDDTKIELIKFEDKSKNIYTCNKYALISINGFVKNAKGLEQFNMSLHNWNYVTKLIDEYDINGKCEPYIELYAHNKVAYEKALELFKVTNRVAIIQATGTGKSYIIFKFLLDYYNKNCLILAPSKYILEQMKLKATWSTQNTTFITYAKLNNLNISEIENLKVDFIVLDEFHRCGAEIWGKGVNRLLDFYQDAKIIGTSATPIRFLDDNRDMSDELFEGCVASNLSLSDAIYNDILPMPNYIAALFTLDEEIMRVKNLIHSSRIIFTEDIINKLMKYKKDWEKVKGIPEVLKKHITNNENKFIVFCEDKEHLSDMEWLVEKWFKKAKLGTRFIKFRVMSGNADNDSQLEDFRRFNSKKETVFLFAVDMLNEGLHIDDISGVILLRNTKSPRIFYQQIGRAIQSGNIDKKPVIFDFVNNFSNIGVDDFIKELNYAKEKRLQIRQSFGLSLDIPTFTIYDETKEPVEFFKDIEMKLNNTWEYRYNQLMFYKQSYGDCLVPKKFKENIDLSKWVRQQRAMYNNNTLVDERINKLNSIGFEWDAKEAHWFNKFKLLEQYYHTHGNCKIERSGDSKLSNWVVKQRQYYNEGTLSQIRIDNLNKLNFEWGPDELWLLRYSELLDYIEENGNSNVPYDYRNEKSHLGGWVNDQRQRYLKGKLSEYKIERLESIGFNWNMIDSRWEEMYEQLKHFKTINGHCDVSRRVHKDDSKLAFWVDRQRAFYKKGKLSDYRIRKLDDLGFKYEIWSKKKKKNNNINEER